MQDNVFAENAVTKTFNAHNIRIYGTVEEPLFRADDIGELLEMGAIRSTLRYFDEDEKGVQIMPTPGGQQQVIMLTEHGLYRLLMISRKPIAKQFQKWVVNVIREIRLNGKYEHTKALEKIDSLESHIKKISKNITSGECLKKTHEEIIRHNCLIDANIGNYCVYIAKVQDLENDEYVVKIGSTYTLNTRKYDLNSKFIDILFMDVFPCDHNHVKFEKMLQNDEIVKANFFSVAKSTETFKITKKFPYETLLRIAKQMHINFKGVTSEDIREDRRIELRKQELDFGRELLERTQTIDIVELQKMVLNLQKNHEELVQIMQTFLTFQQKQHETAQKNHDAVMQILSNNAPPQKAIPVPTVAPAPVFEVTPIKTKRGPRLQIYTGACVYVRSFPSFIEAMRAVEGSARPMIINAAKDKVVYKGYRWHILGEPEEEDVPTDIGATVTRQNTVRKGLIAMLNLERTRIVQVFPDQKTASQARQMSNGAAISKAIRDKTRSSGHYFEHWDDCSQELQAEYLARSDLPQPPLATGAVTIQQIDASTGECVKVFNSIADVIKQVQVSRMSLKKAIQDNTLLKGYRWRQ